MGTVTGVTVDRGVVVRPDGRDQHITLTPQYVTDGHLDHGYAITGHKAQGLTVEHALVVADEAIDTEWGYVAMSRGRHTNHLYLTDPNAADPRRHAPQPADDPTGRLARRLAVSRADTPLVDRDVYDPTETAYRWQRLSTDISEARKTDYERRTLTGELNKLTEQREFLATYYNRDRARLDEVTSGLSRLSKASRRERDRLHGALQGYLERTEQIDRQTLDLRRLLQQLGPRPDIDAWQAEADRLRDVLDAVAAQTARRHEHHPPAWLVDTLGAPPEQPEARALWRDAATRIQAFRTRWQIDDPQRPYGDVLAAPRPSVPTGRTSTSACAKPSARSTRSNSPNATAAWSASARSGEASASNSHYALQYLGYERCDSRGYPQDLRDLRSRRGPKKGLYR